MPPPFKRCSACGAEKESSEFYRNKRRKDGLGAQCRSCYLEYRHKYAKENPEKCHEAERRWRLANREYKRAAYRQWRVENREHRREYMYRWRQENAEHRLLYKRNYRRLHLEETREQGRKYYSSNKVRRERVKEATSRRRALIKGAMQVEKIDREVIYERDGGRCHLCQKKVSPKRFHLDHLVPLAKGGMHTMINLRIACPSCNCSRQDGRLPAQLLLIG